MDIIDFSSFPLEKRDLTNSDQNAQIIELAQQIYVKHEDVLELENLLFRDNKFVSNTSPLVLEVVITLSSAG